ncbi:hypothetical protein [Clostridium neonatale]|uniref:hypothetical protein n=1 Tax=Clostridium neonatale TaxID=137838 RepID=UPI0031406EDE
MKGNLGTNKTGMSYDGLFLTEYLKIETSTSISFTTDSTSTLTLVLNSDFSKYIIVDELNTKLIKVQLL